MKNAMWIAVEYEAWDIPHALTPTYQPSNLAHKTVVVISTIPYHKKVQMTTFSSICTSVLRCDPRKCVIKQKWCNGWLMGYDGRSQINLSPSCISAISKIFSSLNCPGLSLRIVLFSSCALSRPGQEHILISTARRPSTCPLKVKKRLWRGAMKINTHFYKCNFSEVWRKYNEHINKCR